MTDLHKTNELKGTPFTTRERLAFDLGLTKPMIDKESETLRKMIDCMPWLVEVAEYRFDPIISQIILQRESTFEQIKSECQSRINLRLNEIKESLKEKPQQGKSWLIYINH